MNLTSEQTAKIKSSVKTKLVDIGAYVDDQLSEYVMIMITNKKTEKQMTEDLELFLGGIEQAEEFSSWLHGLIKKTCESGSISTPPPSKSSSHHHSGHKKSSSKKSRNGSNSSSSLPHQTSNTSHNESHDELAIQIDSNEFNDDFNDDNQKKANKTDSTKKKTRIPSESGHQTVESKAPVPVQKSESVASSSETKTEEKKAIANDKPSLEEPTNPFTKLVKQQESSNKQSASSLASKVTVIASKIHKTDDNSDEEEFDKRRLSSVIKTSERKYAVPRSMMANKSILLNAVDAANSSVRSNQSSKSKSIADTRLEEIRAKRFARQQQQPERTTTTSSSGSYASDEDQRAKRVKKFETFDQDQEVNYGNNDARTVELQSKPQDPKFIVTLTGLEGNPLADRLDMSTKPKRTLAHMNEEFDEELDYDEEIVDEFMEADENGEPIEVDEEIDGEQELQKKKLTRCTFWPMCDKGDQCLYLHPNKPCTAFPNCTFGNLCHYLHPSCRFDGFCTRPDCPFTHVVKNKSIHAEASKVQDMILDGKTEVTAAPVGTPPCKAPTITINKIQSSYSINNVAKKATEASTLSTATTTIAGTNGAATTPIEAVANKFSLNNNPATTFSQIRMPRAAAPSPYFKANPYAYSMANQYSFVNRATNPKVPTNINCKYGKMCQNPKCIYVHPNLPQKSQLKWTAALANTTNLETPVQQPDSQTETDVKNDLKKVQEPTGVSNNNSMIAQSS